MPIELTVIEDDETKTINEVKSFEVCRHAVAVEFMDGTEALFDELARGRLDSGGE